MSRTDHEQRPEHPDLALAGVPFGEPRTRGEHRPAPPPPRRRRPIKTVSLEDCLRRLAVDESAFMRQTTRADDIMFGESGTLTFGEISLRIEPAGRGGLTACFGAPGSYLANLPGDLQRRLLDHHFRNTFSAEQQIAIVSREVRFETAVNAFTDVGTRDSNLPSRTRHLLSGLGGILAFRDRHLCSRCFSRLTSSVALIDHTDASHE